MSPSARAKAVSSKITIDEAKLILKNRIADNGGHLSGRKLYQEFDESQADALRQAAVELNDAKAICVKGLLIGKNPLDVFQAEYIMDSWQRRAQ